MRIALIAAMMFLSAFMAHAQVKQFNDTVYHFSFQYPDDWVLASWGESNLRAVIYSPGQDLQIEAYAYFLQDAFVDVEKLAGRERELFNSLGEERSSEVNTVVPYIGKYIDWMLEGSGEILDIRKEYGPNANEEYAKAFFTVDEHYAYVLIIYSFRDDIMEADPIFDSFEKEAGWITKWRNNQSWAFRKRSMTAFLFSLATFLYLSALTFIGLSIRKWHSRLIALQKGRNRISAGEAPLRRWHTAKQRTSRILYTYITLFFLMYITSVALHYSSWAFYIIPPFFLVAGYFGYLLVVKEPD